LGVVEQFLNHIQRHNLCKTNDKILLAVSGGIDSMVMLHLFSRAGFSIGVAHCNFQLRDQASDEDEIFVSSYCTSNNIPFYTRKFETARIVNETGKSVQVVARELRYNFFDALVTQHSFDAVATAHHLTDNLETVLLNLTRGTGIDGLAGIPVKNGNIIRPMMFASRDDVRQYAITNGITWREDKSNETDDYSRNLIRHHVLPRLREINPNLDYTFQTTTERIQAAKGIFRKTIDRTADQFVKLADDQVHIDKNIFNEVGHPEVILWELIKDFGFNYEQCRLMTSVTETGKRIHSSDYSLTVDRTSLIISPRIKSEVNASIEITRDTSSITAFGSMLTFRSIPMEKFHLSSEPSIGQLDLSLIKFPLTWRAWRTGDSFRPIGMSSSKKVSDFLIDAKISVPDKEKVTVLLSGDEIVWVVPYRINDKYKVTPKTQEVLIINHQQV
jgi:tRNA(Ile)-lysidine synthase